MIENLLKIVSNYMYKSYDNEKFKEAYDELIIVSEKEYEFKEDNSFRTYGRVQNILSTINEKEDNRKDKGVYYTPLDIVKFILINSINMVYGLLSKTELNNKISDEIDKDDFCYNKIIFDPTCGTGEFLLESLDTKLNMLDNKKVSKEEIERIVSTIKGNDVNNDSIIVAKIRIILCLLNKEWVGSIKGIGLILNKNFTNKDFIESKEEFKESYDIIIGNPPYVEDKKTSYENCNKYGNIYANVLEISSRLLSKNGVIGFIVPISYISTERMVRS